MRGILAILALLSLAGLSLWWLVSLQVDQDADSPAELSAPRLILENFQATRLDQQGVRQYTLQAPQLIQWPSPRGIEVEQPRMVLYREGHYPLWRIKAGQAWLADDQATLRLLDTVEAERQDANPVHLQTQDLTYHPQADTLTTDAPVLLKTARGQMTGRGLYGQIEQQNYTLLSDVRGRYDAPPH